MAEHIKVTLEHHLNRRYHAIKHGAGRRPAAVTYGKFNLRYRDPMLDGKRTGGLPVRFSGALRQCLLGAGTHFGS